MSNLQTHYHFELDFQKLLWYCEALIYVCNNKKQKQVVLHYDQLTNPLEFQLDFQKVDQHTGG